MTPEERVAKTSAAVRGISWLTLRRSGLGWVGVSAAVLLVLSATDLSLPRNANLSGALVVAPFFASVGARPRLVIGVGVAAFVAALVLADADGSGLHASVARVAVVLAGTLVATQAARLRIRRESRLTALTNVAQAAQRAIITEPPPLVGSVAVAASYQSSARAATVGGDCYEALDTPFGTRLMVGDVRGHGLPSVRLAALVVGAFRALAYTEPDLAGVARQLDLVAGRYAANTDDREIDGEEFVTAVFAEVTAARVTIVNCGHPPPVWIEADGTVRTLLASAPTPPLGIGSDPTPDTIEVVAGTRLLLYTDGLIEARDDHGRFFDLVGKASTLASGVLESGVDALMTAFNAHAHGSIHDDVALLAFEPLTPVLVSGMTV